MTQRLFRVVTVWPKGTRDILVVRAHSADEAVSEATSAYDQGIAASFVAIEVLELAGSVMHVHTIHAAG
jgi:hypothetical protein